MGKTKSQSSAVLDAVLQFNHGRKPRLLRQKLRKMSADPFTFFRGADNLFCGDWTELKPLDPGPNILICGDLHLENFGAHRTTQGEYRYDLNDFDEAIIGPCGFDVTRCAASIILASEQWRLTPSQATGMALAYLENYRKAVRHGVERDSVHEIVPHGGHGPIQEILGSTAISTQAQLLAAKTRRKADGRPMIKRSDTALDVSRERSAKVAAALKSHGKRVGKPDAFKLHDLVFRIAGVGSLGVRRYLALVDGDGPPQGYHLLDVKEARPSAVASCASDTLPETADDDARRVVLAQTILQGHVAIGLDTLLIGHRSFRIREMIPSENRSSLDQFQKQPNRLLRAVETAGRLTGWSHLRGARYRLDLDCWPELAAWADGPSLDAILAAAARFTSRTNREFGEFGTALRKGGGVPERLNGHGG